MAKAKAEENGTKVTPTSYINSQVGKRLYKAICQTDMTSFTNREIRGTFATLLQECSLEMGIEINPSKLTSILDEMISMGYISDERGRTKGGAIKYYIVK